MPPTTPLRPSTSTLTSTLTPSLRPHPHPSRPNNPNPQKSHFSTTPHPQARLLRRPKRPYTFTQLLTLSDGSTFTHRTTSPLAVYKSNKDTRNTPLWNPSNVKMANVEEDEAGRLRAFRRRFGRGWDARSEELGQAPAREDVRRVEAVGERAAMEGSAAGEEGATGVVEGVGVRTGGMERGEDSEGRQGRDEEGNVRSESGWSDEAEDNLMDLIGSYGVRGEKEGDSAGVRMVGKAGGGKKKGKK